MSQKTLQRSKRPYQLRPKNNPERIQELRGYRTITFGAFSSQKVRDALAAGDGVIVRPHVSIRKQPFFGHFPPQHLQYFDDQSKGIGCNIKHVARIEGSCVIFTPDEVTISNVPKFIEKDWCVVAGAKYQVSRILLHEDPLNGSYWMAEMTRYGHKAICHPLNLKLTVAEYQRRHGKEPHS